MQVEVEVEVQVSPLLAPAIVPTLLDAVLLFCGNAAADRGGNVEVEP